MPLHITEELKQVRAEAKALGIKFHHRANANTIQNLIDEHMAKFPKAPSATSVEPSGPKMGPGRVMTAAEYREEEAQDRIRSVGALKRIRVTCMNPQKSSWKGETISVGSRKMGTFKKYIPFDGQPYHVPKAIYDVLKERKCTIFVSRMEGKEEFRDPKLINEFAIEDLPPLTQQELADLEKRQALAQNGL